MFRLLTMASTLLALERVWEKDVPRLLSAFQAVGLWKSSSLSRYCPGGMPGVMEAQGLLQELLPDATEDELDGWVPHVCEAVAVAQLERRRADYERGIVPVWEVVAEDWRREKKRDAADYDELFRRQRLAKVHRVLPPKPAQGRSGVLGREARELDGDPRGREKGEAQQRERWIAKMVECMRADGVDDARPRLAAAGRRAATLRTRILAWLPFRVWMERSHGTTVPRGVDDFIDYLVFRSDEPCSRSTLDGIVAMFAFVESLYGRSRGSRWVDSAPFVSASKEVRMSLSRRLDGSEVKKALRPTWR